MEPTNAEKDFPVHPTLELIIFGTKIWRNPNYQNFTWHPKLFKFAYFAQALKNLLGL